MSARCAPHQTSYSLWRAAKWVTFGVCVLLLCLETTVQAQSTSQGVRVTTPEELQEQVRLGTRHIVIAEHLNMVDTPRFSETTSMDDAMLSIVQAGDNITNTIRVSSLGKNDWGSPSYISNDFNSVGR